MAQKGFKMQYLSGQDLYRAKRWEGKPWSFKLKYFVGNYPEFAFAFFGFLVIAPAIVAYRIYTFNEEKAVAMRKFKSYYAVVRDDDPNIEYIKYEKEAGRQYFPQ